MIRLHEREVRGCLHEAGLNSDRPDFSLDVASVFPVGCSHA